MKKVFSIVLSAALIAASLTTGVFAAPLSGASELAKAQRADVVQVRDRGGAVAAGAAVGLIGGLAIGSALADRDRRYCDPRYEYCGGQVYYRPTPRRGLVWNDDYDCWVSRRNYWGPCIR